MRNFILSIVFILTVGQVVFSQTKQSDFIADKKAKTNKIIVYGSDTCHYCLEAKAYLKKNNIDFVYFDVDVNLVKQKEMVIKLQKARIPLDAISLPVVDLQGKIIMNNVEDFNVFLKSLTVKTN